MHLINFPYGAHPIAGKCCVLECKKWLYCWYCRCLVRSRILRKYGNYCAYYLTHNLLGSISNDGRSDITVTLLLLANAVSVGISGKSLCAETQLWSRQMQNSGWGDHWICRSSTKIFAFKVISWEWKVNNWERISSCTGEDK